MNGETKWMQILSDIAGGVINGLSMTMLWNICCGLWSHQIWTQLNVYRRFWTDLLDSILHLPSLNTKWGNTVYIIQFTATKPTIQNKSHSMFFPFNKLKLVKHSFPVTHVILQLTDVYHLALISRSSTVLKL